MPIDPKNLPKDFGVQLDKISQKLDAFAKKGVDAIVTDVPQNFKPYHPLRTTIWLLATLLIVLLIFALWPR